MAYKFSPSTLSLLSECPRCFWLHFNKGIKRPTSIFPSLPSGMDKILKVYFNSFREKGKTPPELAHIKGVRLFDNKRLLEEWQANFRGVQWSDKEGNLFRGAVDELLITTSGSLIVLDFKTRGYPLKDDTPAHYQNQLDIYNLLLRKNGYTTKDYAFLLFLHPISVQRNETVKFSSELVKMNISVENAERIFSEALNVLKSPIPEPAEECQYCKWFNKVSDVL